MQRDERYHREKSIKMILLGQDRGFIIFFGHDRGELQFARNLGNLIFLGQDRGELPFARKIGFKMNYRPLLSIYFLSIFLDC